MNRVSAYFYLLSLGVPQLNLNQPIAAIYIHELHCDEHCKHNITFDSDQFFNVCLN